jgi:hypothetical protein
MNIITIRHKDLVIGLREEGFSDRKIDQFTRVFHHINSIRHGRLLELDSARAMLVNATGIEQGLSLEDFITAWWVYWVVVFSQSTDGVTHHQAIGAIRSLYFVSACVPSTSIRQSMKTWWHECEPLHGHQMMEAM